MNKVSEKGVVLFLIITLLFVTSCQPKVGSAKNATVIISDAADSCTAHPDCIDENYLHFQAENCSWSKPEKCERGCQNGTCIAAPICIVGFKCIDENRRGYQKEDCSFATKVDCEWGCEAGKCNEKPANVTNNTTTVVNAPSSGYSAIAENAEENESIQGPEYTLQLGEEGQIEISGTIHTIKIHNIEVDRVIIKVDDLKSDWITEGGSFTYANIATTITIKSILFQAYGKKEIEYSIK